MVLTAISSLATFSLDTLPYWTIYYGKIILIQGNTSQTITETQEIRIKSDVVWHLNITFNYDTRGPIESKIDVKLGNETIRTLKSTVKDANFFEVPTRDLIDTRTKGKDMS
jgi:hypothetical protein